MTAATPPSSLLPNRRQHVPSYNVTTTIDNRVIGEFMAPIPDPFARTTVTVCWRDLLRSLLTRRSLTVQVAVSADKRTIERVCEMDPDYLGGPDSPSRKAWNASLHDALAAVGRDDDPTCPCGKEFTGEWHYGDCPNRGGCE